jgi:hypothetical protein
MFIHTVFFWLRDNAPNHAAEQLAGDCLRLLKGIPNVMAIHAGPPANTPREVVDNSYAVGLSVTLPDRTAHDVYQDHPLHHEFIARNREHWQRVQVYDFESP